MRKSFSSLFLLMSVVLYAQLSGSGTEDNPYLVSSSSDLIYVASRVNSGDESYSKSYYLQTNDIVLNESISDVNNIISWTPIGSEEFPFGGVYDGGKHTVSGLYINDENAMHQGLFGYNTGTIKYLGIVNSYINADTYVGGICGANVRDVCYCYNEAYVSGSGYVGGICGLNRRTIENCFNLGYITGYGSSCVGGIAGVNMCEDSGDYSTIRNCYNAGQIFSLTSEWIGGISGIENLSVIEYCYNTGFVGVFGGAVSSQYTTSKELFFDNQTCPISDSRAKGLSTLEMVSTYLFDDENWEYNEGCYPQIKSIKTERSLLYATPIYFADVENVDNVVSDFKVSIKNGVKWSCKNGLVEIDTDGNVKIKSDGEEVLVASLGQNYRELPIKIVLEPNVNGVGTKANPYKISSVEEFIEIANKINNDVPLYDKLCYKVTNNLVFNTNLLEKISKNDTVDLVKWTPIKKFSGNIDFQMNFVEGLYINSSESNQGLFAYNEGEIKGVFMINSYIEGNKKVGAICAENAGLIKSCIVQNSIIEGCSMVGGICGENLDNGEINTCLNKSDIYERRGAAQYVAGICAFSRHAKVLNCRNDGNIIGNGRMGGICGTAFGLLEHCLNTGSIIPLDENNYFGTYVGGICGVATMTQIQYCVNSGLVVGKSYTGGIVGFNTMGDTRYCLNIGYVVGDENDKCGAIIGQKDPIEQCYYDIQISGIGDRGSSIGLTTADITNGELFCDSEHWFEVAGCYPGFASKYLSLNVGAMFLSNRETVDDIKSNFTVTANTSWTTVNGKIKFDNTGNATIYSVGNDTIMDGNRKIPVYISENPNQETGDVIVLIPSSGYTTLYHNTALLVPEGLKAYYVSEIYDGHAVLTEILGIIPSYTGVILCGEEGEYLLTLMKDVSAIADNMLRGSIETKNIIPEIGTYYKLKELGEETMFIINELKDGMFYCNGGEAYLFIPDDLIKQTYIKLTDDIATKITDVKTDKKQHLIYDLQGRIRKEPQNGIYIINGEKIIKL